MSGTPEQQVGDLAARALDQIAGRRLVGAVLILAVEDSDEGDMTATSWFVPGGQAWQLTLGMVEDWRITQAALITASALDTGDGDEDDVG